MSRLKRFGHGIHRLVAQTSLKRKILSFDIEIRQRPMYHCPEVVSHAFSHRSESLTGLFLRKINVLGLLIAENPRNQRPTPIQDPIWGRGPSRISQAKRIGMALIMLGAKDHMYLHTRFQGIYPELKCVQEFWYANLSHEPCPILEQNTDSGPEIWSDRSEKVASQASSIY